MDYLLQIILNTVVLGAMYSLLALGFNLLYSHNKFFDLSYAAYMLIGAYSYLFLSKTLSGQGFSSILVFLLAIIVAVLFSLVIEKYLYRKLREKKASGSVMMIASLGVLTVAQAIIAILFSSNIQTLSTGSQSISLTIPDTILNSDISTLVTDTDSVHSVYFTYLQIYIVVSAIALYMLTYFVIKKSKYGMRLRAVSDNEELALASGVDINKIHIWTTVAASAIGATIVIMYGMDTSIDPYMGMSLLLKGVIVAIIGGLGYMMYGAAAALLLAIIETAAVWYIGGEWKDAVAFLVLILLLLIKPTGIFSPSLNSLNKKSNQDKAINQ